MEVLLLLGKVIHKMDQDMEFMLRDSSWMEAECLNLVDPNLKLILIPSENNKIPQ